MNPHVYLAILLMFGFPVAWAGESKTVVTPEIQAAAERGEADAQFQLARSYLRGEGVPKNPGKAFELMKAAAEQGNAEAIGGLGYFYSIGMVVPKDEKQAVGWFRKGAEKGSAKAQLNLGTLLINGKESSASTDPDKSREEGLQWIKKAADQNLPEAGLSYGRILYFGEHGVKSDEGNAKRYFRIAADAGNDDAQNFLGVMNETGAGGPVDTAAAQEWFRKSALQGNHKAQGNLGRILGPLSENKEVRIESLAWLMIASDQGEVTAQKELEDSMAGLKEGDLNAARREALELHKLVDKKAR